MKYLALLLIFGFGLSGFGQTIKSLGYNTTNGQVVANTTNALTFTNQVAFSASDMAIYGSGLTSFGVFLNFEERRVQDVSITNDVFNWSSGEYVELGLPIAFVSTNNAFTTRTNLGLGWPALTNTNAATSLLGFTTNGEVVANTGTNALTFTNRFRQSSTNATNPPEIRLTTKSNNVASWFYYDAFGAGGANTTNDVDWSVLWLGNNHVPSSSGLDFGRADQSIGAISLTMENMYYAGSLPSPSHVGEFYINISDYTTNGSGTTRAMFVVGSQTNSARGQVSFAYPVYLNYNQEAVDWLSTGSGLGGLNVGTTNSFQLATFYNTGTAHGGEARISIGAPANQMAVAAGPNYGWIRQFGAARTAFYINTNGVIYGSTQGNAIALAPVHLAGNTRIDGAISFDSVSNAAITRTNLGLGETNAVAFSGIYNNGNLTNINGTIYGLKTNVGPFEGIGNFFASNNTTVGNETLFRVGVAETTNKSAQFGFRVTRTNNGGEGLAVFSVFGYNALMMIGPSDRSRSNSLTNTNAAIEADIWTMSETNRVMTLRDTNTGAMVMHRPIGFNTNDSNVLTTAPANTNVTNPTGWIQIYVGTNSVRVPYYQ